jgi:hypothetical protein
MHMQAVAGRRFDKEYSSCFYLLSSSDSIYQKTKACINVNGVKTTSVLRKSYSTSEEYIAKIAVALFNSISSLKTDFYWVVKLDTTQYEVVMEAFRIRRSI